MKAELNNRDYKIGLKKVRRLMEKFNLKAICSDENTNLTKKLLAKSQTIF
ncbi:hypothetical protein [Mesomycoplasma hyopneumoniae]